MQNVKIYHILRYFDFAPLLVKIESSDNCYLLICWVHRIRQGEPRPTAIFNQPWGENKEYSDFVVHIWNKSIVCAWHCKSNPLHGAPCLLHIDKCRRVSVLCVLQSGPRIIPIIVWVLLNYSVIEAHCVVLVSQDRITFIDVSKSN